MCAAMPPLEAKRVLFQMAAMRNKERPMQRCELLFMDVKRPT